MRSWSALLGGTLVLASCTGVIAGSGGGTDDPAATPDGKKASSFTCDPAKVPAELPLRRLSRVQYLTTVHDVVSEVAPKQASAILAEVKAPLDKLPADARVNPTGDKHGGFRRLDQTVQQDFVDATYDAAVALGKAMTSSKERLEALAGSCATDADASNDDKCLDDMIRKVGAIAHRRPLVDADVALYRETAGSDRVKPEALADVVAHMLTGPYFLYHVEHGATAADTTPLSGVELANRLSYHF